MQTHCNCSSGAIQVFRMDPQFRSCFDAALELLLAPRRVRWRLRPQGSEQAGLQSRSQIAEQQPGTDWEREDNRLHAALDTALITAAFPPGVGHQPTQCQPQLFLLWAECIFSQISVPSICSWLMLWQHGPSLVFWLLPWEIASKAHYKVSFLRYSAPLLWGAPLLGSLVRQAWVWIWPLAFPICVILEKLPTVL